MRLIEAQVVPQSSLSETWPYETIIFHDKSIFCPLVLKIYISSRSMRRHFEVPYSIIILLHCLLLRSEHLMFIGLFYVDSYSVK